MEGVILQAKKTIFWDLNGTLAFPRYGMWGEVMIRVLKEYHPDTALVPSDFRRFFEGCFPWDHPEKAYTHIQTPEQWWEPFLGNFAQGYIHHGVSEHNAYKLADAVRNRFIDPDSWSLFEDTADTLEQLSKRGWRHVIVSNHVPELGPIIESLGLNQQIAFFVNSAAVGYEKPHPEIYKYAWEQAGNPEELWMVGDTIEADVFGPEALGIKGILVRNIDSRAKYNCKGLRGVIDIVE